MALEELCFPEVLSLLRDSLNADRTLRDTAVMTLSPYERRLGFYSVLVNIITAEGPHVDDDVRLSASNHLEKTIMRYWGNSFFVSDDEKTYLRSKLLLHLHEENDQIAQMLAIVISKIAAFDYPQRWPELFRFLVRQLEEGEGDIFVSHRILEVLSRTISRLSEEDLKTEGTTFAEISSKLFDSCWKLWEKDVRIVYDYLNSQPSEAQQLDLTFGSWLFSLSKVETLFTSGFHGDAKFRKVLIKSVCNAFRGTIKLVLYGYTLRDFSKLSFDPSICVDLVKCLVRIQDQCSSDDETVSHSNFKFFFEIIARPLYGDFPFYEQLLIRCTVMVKSFLEPTQYIPWFSHPTFNDTFIKSLKFLDVMQLCEILIRRYFLLTKDDLKKWSHNPESFYHEKEMIAKKLRPHAEALYNVVFERYGEWLGPVVLSILRETTNDRPAKETDSNHEILLREAAYTAVAHACHWLFGELDFKKLFEGVLCPELRNGHPNMRIIHRKIALIVQKWTYKAEADVRKPVFCSLLKVLEYDDVAVKLAACRPLQYLFEQIDFQEEDSMDLHSYWGLSLKLLDDVQEFRSKMLVLDSILSGIIKIGEKMKKNSIIVKIGEKIIPFADKLVDEIEKACDKSTGNMILQIIILRALHCLNELGIHNLVCYKILPPVLEMCNVVNDLDKFIVLMYGMELWESTLSHARSMDSQLLLLFPYLQKVVEESVDLFPKEIDHINALMKVAFEIINGYIKLGVKTCEASDIQEAISENLNIIQECLSGGLRKRASHILYTDPDEGCERPKGKIMISIKKRKLFKKYLATKGLLIVTSS